MKPIDADALLRWVQNSKQDNPCNDKQGKAIWDFVHDHLLRMISDAPVVRGKWSKKELDSGMLAICNQCNYPVSWWHKSNFCPNCGARMDGDSECL